MADKLSTCPNCGNPNAINDDVFIICYACKTKVSLMSYDFKTDKEKFPFVTWAACKTCRLENCKFDLVKRKTSSGHWQIFYYCRNCASHNSPEGKLKFHDISQLGPYDDNNKKIFLPKSYLNYYHIDINDLIELNCGELPRCFVCNSPGAELHHFAPQHLFDDAHYWPEAYLCDTHHKEWHDKIKNHWK